MFVLVQDHEFEGQKVLGVDTDIEALKNQCIKNPKFANIIMRVYEFSLGGDLIAGKEVWSNFMTHEQHAEYTMKKQEAERVNQFTPASHAFQIVPTTKSKAYDQTILATYQTPVEPHAAMQRDLFQTSNTQAAVHAYTNQFSIPQATHASHASHAPLQHGT